MKTRLQVLDDALANKDIHKIIKMFDDYKQQGIDESTAEDWFNEPIEKTWDELVQEWEDSLKLPRYDSNSTDDGDEV